MPPTWKPLFGRSVAGVRFHAVLMRLISFRVDGNDLVLNGRKWYISGATDPRCKIIIFMGRTHGDLSNVPAHRRHSMVLVPMNTPGVEVVRPMRVMGFDDAPHGHAEMTFTDVRVNAKEAMILGEGRGFEIAQGTLLTFLPENLIVMTLFGCLGRLGPGRIHHCMRLIGNAERSLQLMCQRATSRVAFNKPLAEMGTIQADIANSRVEINMTRLLCLNAAMLMDKHGNKAAKQGIILLFIVLSPWIILIRCNRDRGYQSSGAKNGQANR
jgi:acyl-CoA dehydrogenase